MKIFFSNKTKRAFTLVEMLIVIVIIGILAAALIPRLSSARARANDTARKADLQQVASALVAYQIDNGRFPTADNSIPSLSYISTSLISAGLSSLPLDPNRARTTAGISTLGTPTTTTPGQYAYTTILKGGQSNNGFVLMAGTETPGGSNRVYTGEISIAASYENIVPCASITAGAANLNNGGACTYIKGSDVLRYIYVY